ncbi:DTW domain-containing protein [Catenovulum agarivorans DS-2]|uniref:tRNA-uridine aminocarboxypropyltransferase n=1 Tax=Catenovulum agarivorans DS-2 TaxID=1328313 RepID=W7R2M1_9ALTE|nr:DTW domain-containing protein [Catenovulum agarivorans]EWH11880.1 DTW domain-containing protein [Catenovulum agarivorans DS-2]
MNFFQFRQQRLSKATKAFNARGVTVKRCQQCQLPTYACICSWQPKVTCAVDIVLIMHTDEILKPSNTGHLISDVFTDKCFLFEWSRTEPAHDLLKLLNDPQRHCVILFPPPTDDKRKPARPIHIAPNPPTSSTDKNLTLVVLDGTWRQCKRMFNQSKWLYHLPCIDLNVSQQAQYKLRKSTEAHQLATAEAAALALAQWHQLEAAQILQAYFELFNLHYAASKLNVKPTIGPTHHFLQQLLEHSG